MELKYLVSPSLVGLLVGLFVAIFVLYPMFLEARSVYFPSRSFNATPARWGLEYEEVSLTTEDGLRLSGWYIPNAGAKSTVLWFHANAHNISQAYDSEWLVLIQSRLAANLFIFDYRGYGRSEGKPSEEGTYRDARAALSYLRSRPDVDSSRIIYFGHSLGSAVATDLATKVEPMGLILWSPFSSFAEAARHHYPILGHVYTALPGFPRIKYDSISKIRRIDTPTLILHGDNDALMPLWMGWRLQDAAKGPANLVAIPGGTHNHMPDGGWDIFLTSAEGFIRRLEQE